MQNGSIMGGDQMKEGELGTQSQSYSVEKTTVDLSVAERLTSEALNNNKLPSEQSFLEGLQENLQGAKAWLNAKMPRRKFLTSAAEAFLAVSIIMSYAPKADRPVMAANGEDNRAMTTEVSPQSLPVIDTDSNYKWNYPEFLEKVASLDKITIDEIESGAYTIREREMLASGKIKPFSADVKPFPIGSVENVDFYNGVWKMPFVVDDMVYHEYNSTGRHFPYEVSDLSVTEINGQKVLVMGVKYLNIDRSVSFLHYGFQSFDDEKNAKMISRMIDGESEFYPISQMEMDEIVGVPIEWFDFGKEKVVSEKCKTRENENIELYRQWAETGIVPKELENQLLQAMPWPWQKK